MGGNGDRGGGDLISAYVPGSAFEQVDVTLIYAARTLGFSESRIFWRVILPSAMPGVLSGAILAFARGLGEFGATAMLAGNIAGKTQTLPLAIY